MLTCSLACTGNSEKQPAEPPIVLEVMDTIASPAEPAVQKSFLCFLSTENELPSRNLRDSILMNLEINGNEISGNFDWIPAEKDRRLGRIDAIKEGDELKGKYIFTQEGIEDTVDINISLQKTSATITTLSETGEKMAFQVERVDCW